MELWLEWSIWRGFWDGKVLTLDLGGSYRGVGFGTIH